MELILNNLYERVAWILEQQPYHRLLHTWQIGECLNEAGAMEERPLLEALLHLVNARHGLKWTVEGLRQMCRVHAAFPRGVDERLSWSHYCRLARVRDFTQRSYYAMEAARSGWTIADLTRQIRTDFYRRSQPYPFKRQYCFEFLKGLPNRFSEQQLEQQLSVHLSGFLLELGYGFSLVARQQAIRTASGQTLFVDWVFYHFVHRCFVLIDLKVQPLKHHHVGQMDTYVRLFDQYWKGAEDIPTLGLLLCTDWDATTVQHSAMAGSEQLWVAKWTE